jgi:hypothetical protein
MMAGPEGEGASWNECELFGSWRVVSAKGVLVDADGTRTESGKDLEGVIIFTPQRRMIAFVADPGRSPAKTDQETLQLFRTMTVYTGRFRLDPGKYVVDIDASSTQLNMHEPQVRLYRIDGDTLTIETPEHSYIHDPAKRNSALLTAIRER